MCPSKGRRWSGFNEPVAWKTVQSYAVLFARRSGVFFGFPFFLSGSPNQLPRLFTVCSPSQVDRRGRLQLVGIHGSEGVESPSDGFITMAAYIILGIIHMTRPEFVELEIP
jgi:hypothetical protein